MSKPLEKKGKIRAIRLIGNHPGGPRQSLGRAAIDQVCTIAAARIRARLTPRGGLRPRDCLPPAPTPCSISERSD